MPQLSGGFRERIRRYTSAPFQNLVTKKSENYTSYNMRQTVTVTVEAPVSGHPREAEKVSATGAGRLQECVNTEFV